MFCPIHDDDLEALPKARDHAMDSEDAEEDEEAEEDNEYSSPDLLRGAPPPADTSASAKIKAIAQEHALMRKEMEKALAEQQRVFDAKLALIEQANTIKYEKIMKQLERVTSQLDRVTSQPAPLPQNPASPSQVAQYRAVLRAGAGVTSPARVLRFTHTMPVEAEPDDDECRPELLKPATWPHTYVKVLPILAKIKEDYTKPGNKDLKDLYEAVDAAVRRRDDMFVVAKSLQRTTHDDAYCALATDALRTAFDELRCASLALSQGKDWQDAVRRLKVANAPDDVERAVLESAAYKPKTKKAKTDQKDQKPSKPKKEE